MKSAETKIGNGYSVTTDEEEGTLTLHLPMGGRKYGFADMEAAKAGKAEHMDRSCRARAKRFDASIYGQPDSE